MGWIRKVFRRVSIPVAFIICGLGSLLGALALTRATVWFARKSMNEIESEYEVQLVLEPDILQDAFISDKESVQIGMVDYSSSAKVYHYVGSEFSQIQGQVQYAFSPEDAEQEPDARLVLINTDAFQEADQKKYDFFEGLDGTAAILWYSVCLCIAAVIFYFWKIKRPFGILNRAVQKISENDLDYRIDYDSQDEFGRLCHAFEIMRQELVYNNRKMWDSVEERKRLNAAFAHDLRTPLTVLRGHVDLLTSALPDDGSTDRELACSVRAISQQITRLNAYVDTMGTLQRLEDYEPCFRRISSSALSDMVSETASLLFPDGKTEVSMELGEGEMLLDREAFAQICENILSNAARYAREKIEVSLRQEEDELVLCVEDDGVGFSEKDLASASLAYYRGEKTEAGTVTHFGLGLYICNLLAGKLGGTLNLSNRMEGGGRVIFKCQCGQG